MSSLPHELFASQIRKALSCSRPGCPCTKPGPTGLSHCPCHDDQHPSLSVSVRDGKVLVWCGAGCRQEDVIESLRERGLWPERDGGAAPKRERAKKTVTRYEVRAPDGRLVAVHVREDGPAGKKLSWWSPDGRPGLDGARVESLPLYGIHLLGDADRVVVCEGEKATDALLRLGLPAVGTVTGASATPGDEALRPLLGQTVYLWPDHDEPGCSHMERIARRLYALGHHDIHVVNWPDAPPGGDAADFVAQGATRADVERLLQQAVRWRPPEAPDGAELLRELERYFTRYLVLPQGAPLALAAWTMATWVVDAFEVAPYLAITSAERRCGKTTLLDLLSFVVREPVATANISEAALFRVVQAKRPTLLIDEAQQLGDRTERSAALHDLLAAGHVRGRPVYRVTKTKGEFRLEPFDCFGFKAVALIGSLTDVLADRSIRIYMHRRAPHERVERFRRLRVRAETEDLRRRLEAWATANEARVREAYLRTEPPGWMHDRAADNWSVLWAVVEAADPSRLGDLEASAQALEGDGQDLNRESVGVRLLADLKLVFEERQADWLRTETIVDDLRSDPEAPWRDWKGRGLTAHTLARILRRYGVHPEKRRLGERAGVKGYSRAALEDVWLRYCWFNTLNPPHPPQPSNDGHSGPQPNPPQEGGCGGFENGPNPRNDGLVEVVELWGPENDPLHEEEVPDIPPDPEAGPPPWVEDPGPVGPEPLPQEDPEAARARRRSRGLCEGCGSPVAVLGGRPVCSRCGWRGIPAGRIPPDVLSSAGSTPVPEIRDPDEVYAAEALRD